MGRNDQRRRQKRKEKLAKAKRAARSGKAKPRVRENPRFNRIETSLNHIYFNQYGHRGSGEIRCDGWIKCRLLHGRGYSLIIPDQIYLEHRGLRWIQPLAFSPNVLARLSDTEVSCEVGIDISCGHRIWARFKNTDIVVSLPDGSQIYRCQLEGPPALHRYSTGEAEWRGTGAPYICLYHHTQAQTVPLIRDSRHFRTSPFNIQGSQKQLENVGYAYFTPLDVIRYDSDLHMIAMAEAGFIDLRRDGFEPPPILFPDYEQRFSDDVLRLPVYRCDPLKRETAIPVWIDASVLAPQHIYYHDEGGAGYYEIPHRFIHRVGAEPGGRIEFGPDWRIHRQVGLKHFDYIVVGDCTTWRGWPHPTTRRIPPT